MSEIKAISITDEVEAAAVADVLAASDSIVAQPVALPKKRRSRAVSRPVPPVAADPAKHTSFADKEIEMATTTETMQDKTAQMMGDMGERAKGSFQKTSKMVEDAAGFARDNVEAMVESSRIAAKGLETLGQDAADYARRTFESNSTALRSLSGVKSPTEFMQLQSELMRQSFDALVQQTSRSTEQMLKIAGEVSQPISNRMAVATDKLKVAV